MRRTMDARALNAVANHPDVRPWLGGEGELDLGPTLASPLAYGLEVDGGGFLYVPLGPCRYEVHSLFLPDARGKSARAAALDGLEFMFLRTDCLEVVTKVPEPNRAALGLVQACGFEQRFSRPDAWEGDKSVAFYALPLERWMMRPRCSEAGRAFHEWLEGVKAEAGSPLPTHAEDPAHDCAAGCAMLMAKAGNPTKAVYAYNRWAEFAGYQSIALLSVTPPVIDVRDAVLAVNGDQLEVMTCR